MSIWLQIKRMFMGKNRQAVRSGIESKLYYVMAEKHEEQRFGVNISLNSLIC